jgi:AraC family ethanolamine operon transcriptional activator
MASFTRWPASPGRVRDLRTTNPWELEAASPGWDVRYEQLGTGRCRCRHASLTTPRLQLCVESWSLGMLKTGRGPRGSVAFLVPLGRTGASRLQGRPASAGDVLVVFDGDEFDYRSDGPARLVCLNIERAALEQHVRTRLGSSLGELRLQGRLSGLRAHAAFPRLCRSVVASDPNGLSRASGSLHGLEAKLVKALLRGDGGPREPEPPSRGRSLARKAEAWLRENLAEPPTIAVLCAALQSSERTLHEAFREHLGTTPKAYLKTLRLNAAHHDLLRAVGKTRVTDVALDWGFLHFGWFSQDYRRLFGETPSETLQRSRAEAARRVFTPPISPALGIQ